MDAGIAAARKTYGQDHKKECQCQQPYAVATLRLHYKTISFCAPKRGKIKRILHFQYTLQVKKCQPVHFFIVWSSLLTQSVILWQANKIGVILRWEYHANKLAFCYSSSKAPV